MNIIGISFFTVGLYLVASVLQAWRLRQSIRVSKWWMVGLGFFAIILHALLLHLWIDLSSGQNLDFFNMFSLTAWLVSVLTLMVIMLKPLDVLALIVFPITAFSILLVLAFPADYLVKTMRSPDALFHILLSIVTFCVLLLAALIAVLLAVQERLLRYKRCMNLLNQMPPLEALEGLMFQVISLGFILLSVVIVTSIYFYHTILAQQILLIQKAVLAIIAWFIFAGLLIGRYRWGLRGKKAIYFTLAGVCLLFIAYFGSKILLEVWH